MIRKRTEVTEADIRAKINERFNHWNDMALHGCCDPGWPDGTNMNLTRNHILHEYRILEEHGFAQRDLFGNLIGERPLPPEVSDKYMVQNGRYPNRLAGKYRDDELVWGTSGEYEA